MPRNYVDNAYNRSIGRVGMPVGSMVVSTGGGGGSSYSGGGGSSYSGGGSSSYSGGGGSSYSSSSLLSTRTYVDNAYNRNAGRVGLPVGSAVISSGKSSSTSGSSYSGCPGYSTSSASDRTYVDNDYNRRAGRVGLPVGSAVISSGKSSSTSGSSYSGSHGYSTSSASDRTYVDNAFNRSAGRVGLPVGSAVISKKSETAFAGKSQSSNLAGATSKNGDMGARPKEPKKYVDNAYNRKHNRVGLEHGTKVISKQQPEGPSGKVYVDNALNRKLGRVGKLVGTAVYDNKTGKTVPRTYADTYKNRKAGRVGQPKGSRPTKRNGSDPKTDKITKDIRDKIEKWISVQQPPEKSDIYDRGYDDGDSDDDYRGYVCDGNLRPPSPYDIPCPEAENIAKYYINRKEEEIDWMTEENSASLKTSSSLIANYKGSIIPFNDLKLGRKIGEGGFGEVFFAKYHKTVVAVKKLRAATISKKREKQFTEEVLNFCDLDHDNIVKFLGVVTERPNLCIVMEYMKTSLFDVLFINNDDDELTEDDRQDIIDGMCAGLTYLHDEGIAHCDIKSQNILLDNDGDGYVAKITDFGLSMVKTNTETTSAAEVERVQKVGTPRYSAPEVLRGEMLSRWDMMKADVYSLALVIFEVVFEDEPYYNLSYPQLQKQVGELGKLPEMDAEDVNEEVVDVLKKALNYEPTSRPTAQHLKDSFLKMKNLFIEEEEESGQSYSVI